MDSIRGFEEDAGLAPAVDDEPLPERPPEIGVDERRMHVRAYNYWVSLLEGRPYPSIEDLDPANIEDFGPHSVLLDFSGDPEDPQIVFLGKALRIECGLETSDIGRISQVPSRSLLSRLTDHYLQIIANCAPIGFEAEFVSQRGFNTLYRGILMPLSSNGEAIDFIYGVINWKELVDGATQSALARQMDHAIAAAAAPAQHVAADCPVWADGPNAQQAPQPGQDDVVGAGDAAPPTLGLWPDEEALAPRSLPDDAGLADRLGLARESAEAAAASDQRSRASLYRALGHAYDFACAADGAPGDYAELLADAGLKAQARAPMTPVVKLVFGAAFDKTRLTEYAACLAWARREGLAPGALASAIEAAPGGLKGIVQAERRARRPAPRPDRVAEIRDRLRTAPAFGHVEIEMPEESGEFVLLVGRREKGSVAILAPVADARLIDQAIRKSAA
jgi:hypothetical protein